MRRIGKWVTFLLCVLFMASLLFETAVAAPNARTATIVLDVQCDWNDGSGYQMLLDADANTFGSLIPESGPLSRGDSTAEVYGEFEYKIPGDAGWTCDTTEIIRYGNSVELQIPAGTYDFCLVNPTAPNNSYNTAMWIVGIGGTGPSRYDNYTFKAGHVYKFTVKKYGNIDGVELTIINNLPETGDSASITLWAALLVVAAIGLALMNRKKRAL